MVGTLEMPSKQQKTQAKGLEIVIGWLSLPCSLSQRGDFSCVCVSSFRPLYHVHAHPLHTQALQQPGGDTQSRPPVLPASHSCPREGYATRQLHPAVLALARSLWWVLEVLGNAPAILLTHFGWGSFGLLQ